MNKEKVVFVGLDASKATLAISVADGCAFRGIRPVIPITSGHLWWAAARPEFLVIRFGCFRHLF